MSTPKVIALTYELRSAGTDGEVIEIVEKDQPAEFLVGIGNLIQEFEEQVIDLKPGETFDFVVESDKAYGELDQQAIVNLPRNIFVVDGKESEEMLVVGNMIPMRDQNGHPLQGKVLEIGDTTVKMDFNHPLAGLDLHFKGEILSTREASQEELEHKHVHTGKDGH